MKVILSNRVAKFVPECPDAIREMFRYRKPGYYFAPSYRQGAWDGYINMVRWGKVSAGLFLAYRDEILQCGIDWEIEDERETPKFRKDTAEPDDKKYRYQMRCVRAMIGSANTGGIILAATGSGKTRIAGKFFRRLRGCGIFIVDELTLLRQVRSELATVLEEPVGIVGDQEFEPARITVATIQTLHKHRNDDKFIAWAGVVEVMIIDELHLALNKRNIDVVRVFQPKAAYGLTATLQLDKPHVAMRAYDLTGPVIFDLPVQVATDRKVLAPGLVIGLNIVQKGDTDLDYRDAYEKFVVDGKLWNTCVVGLVREAYRRGKHIVVLVERVRHLKSLSADIKVPHRLAYGEISAFQRLRAKTRFDAGKIRLIIANKVFKKGIDIRRIDLIIDACCLKSQDDAMQKYGRGKRLCDGKVGLIYIDMGFRSPEKKGSVYWNRFARTTRRRRKAFRRGSVPIFRMTWKDDPKAVLDKAEQRLTEIVGHE